MLSEDRDHLVGRDASLERGWDTAPPDGSLDRVDRENRGAKRLAEGIGKAALAGTWKTAHHHQHATHHAGSEGCPGTLECPRRRAGAHRMTASSLHDAAPDSAVCGSGDSSDRRTRPRQNVARPTGPPDPAASRRA